MFQEETELTKVQKEMFKSTKRSRLLIKVGSYTTFKETTV